jgi:hypothetical protein
MDNRKAKRTDLKIHAMPKARALLHYQRDLTPAQYKRLRHGFIPESMDDRWFFFKEGEWTQFHRSWTGYCIFRVRVERSGNRWSVTEVWVNRNSKQYNPSDDRSALEELDRLFDIFICRRGCPS